jgi:superfamily II DNA or RNA helicase
MGNDLYGANKIEDMAITPDHKMTAQVDGQLVSYDLDGTSDFCSCPRFQQNQRFCEHIAAIEKYLQHHQETLDAYKDAQGPAPEVKLESRFIKAMTDRHQVDDFDRLQLTVALEESSGLNDFGFSGDFWVMSLRLSRSDGHRAYMVRNIPQFLQLIQSRSIYELGKGNYGRLSYKAFDDDSKTLLDFLYNMTAMDELQIRSALFRRDGRYLALSLQAFVNGLPLFMELPEFELTLSGRTYHHVSLKDLDPEVDGLVSLQVKAGDDALELQVNQEDYASYYNNLLLFRKETFYHLDYEQAMQLEALNKLDFTHENIDYDDKDRLAESLRQLSSVARISKPDSLTIITPTARFEFSQDQTLDLKLTLTYEDQEITSLEELNTLAESRDLSFEDDIWVLMNGYGFPKSFSSSRQVLTSDDLYEFFEVMVPEFSKLGTVTISQELSEQRVSESFQLNVTEFRGLLDVSFDMPDVSDDEMADLVAQVQTGASHYITESGKLLLLDQQFDGLRDLVGDSKEGYKIDKQGHINLPLARTFGIVSQLNKLGGVAFSEKFQAFVDRLLHPERIDMPSRVRVNAELRDYQVQGVKWLSVLAEYGMGGILADDMGLGKTIQAITFLANALDPELNEQALVVAPASLVYNWQDEWQKFAPSIDIQVVQGTKEERTRQLSESHQVYISSYQSVLKDFDAYKDKEITYLMLDEAQAVKNDASKTSKVLRSFHAKSVFALTGTPIENNLSELWSIFQIVLPNLLGTKKAFKGLSAHRIQQMIAPFILRRTKDQVLTELPDKLEIVQYTDLTDEQKVVYMAQLQAITDRVSNMTSAQLATQRIEILAGITRLRQICDSPSLYLPNYTGGSGKVEAFKEILQVVRETGHRPLIFTQFTSFFPLIEEAMSDIDVSYYHLAGSTPVEKRQSMVKAFNSGSRDAFLISLKAGGVGLNLTGADVVILLDLWWNPAVEEQAISRAHRMGQKNLVEVIRLVTKGTIEEQMMKLQAEKKQLFNEVLSGELSNAQMTDDDLMQLLGIETHG